MKRIIPLLFALFISVMDMAAYSADRTPMADGDPSGAYFGGRKVLIAYFSWGGTTQHMAQEIQRITGGDLFRIEPVTPYPTNYTECTQVALHERDNDERPAIKNAVENFGDYDIIFIGYPVWWHTAPMIISTFAETYDFTGKTVVPFCTYASTYRDETLQKIVDLTPAAEHLQGLGTTDSTSGVQNWIDLINGQWNPTAVSNIHDDTAWEPTRIYNLQGQPVSADDIHSGIYILSDGTRTRKIAVGNL